LFTLAGAKVESCTPNEDGTHAIVLNRTIFHPQGGGQPADQGTVSTADGSAVFAVHMVKEDRVTGLVEHVGSFTAGGTEALQAAAESLQLTIDKERRRTCARVDCRVCFLHLCARALQASNVTNVTYLYSEASKACASINLRVLFL
jgi:Ser-tRNA(Ala) deacylase AlaX